MLIYEVTPFQYREAADNPTVLMDPAFSVFQTEIYD